MKPNYGDNDFKGNGLIRCAACDEPLRDHRIGPCPTLANQTIHVAAIRRRHDTPDPNRGRLNPVKEKA